jgi:serine protease AprX
MAVPIPRSLIDFVLLGPVDDRRQLQDSPILGDVWLAFAAAPAEPVELLITPSREKSAAEAAVAIHAHIRRRRGQPNADVAPLQGIVAARLYFHEVLSVVVPMTGWWQSERIERQLKAFFQQPATEGGETVAGGQAPPLVDEKGEAVAKRLDDIASAILVLARDWKMGFQESLDADLMPALDRLLALSALILWAGQSKVPPPTGLSETQEAVLARALRKVPVTAIVDIVMNLLEQLRALEDPPELIYQVSLNRRATPALDSSVPAVKADAAKRLFGVDCSKIAWAVLDSGINGDHPAFLLADGESRVQQSFDFSRIREIVSLDNVRDSVRKQRVGELLDPLRELRNPPAPREASRLLLQLAEDARELRPVQWELVLPLVEIEPKSRPDTSDHGTHVAGIIGAARPDGGADDDDDPVDGMCPDIRLYDFRVLARTLNETEFAIIGALQLIRYLNSRTEFTTIHGANLSLSIPHNVRNYACGRTPICMECERLVESGVVVVAAAGNHGYKDFQTREGSFEGYAAYSITDPGNADGVITVGATHRSSPHTYGVSFFSSRGPTGDGRAKPDLVAPGERIRGPFRDGWGDLDGTSMAAPHVSGAAAMLMARYSEFIGQPRRIKSILCSSATDLARERGFQGNGMLDVLRAFQSV